MLCARRRMGRGLRPWGTPGSPVLGTPCTEPQSGALQNLLHLQQARLDLETDIDPEHLDSLRYSRAGQQDDPDTS